MLEWLSPSGLDRRLLAGGHVRGPTAYVIAIMTFAMVMVAAAGIALANAAGVVSRGVEHRYTVQIPGAGAALDRTVLAIRSAPGVTSVEPVSRDRMAATLERWLGPTGGASDLPIPALVHVDLEAEAKPDQFAEYVQRTVPGSTVVTHRETLRPLLRSLAALQWLAWALVALMAAATSAAVILAARGALDTHRSTIDVMHGIGATDLQIAHLFQRRIALDALAGSVAGGVAAALILLLLGSGSAALAGDLAGGPVLRGRDLVMLALLPLAAVLLASGVARFAVLAALRRSL